MLESCLGRKPEDGVAFRDDDDADIEILDVVEERDAGVDSGASPSCCCRVISRRYRLPLRTS